MASFPIILAGVVIKAAGTAPQTGTLNALIAEIDENVAMKTGHKITGTIYSCSSVGIKVGTGIGTAICGFLLDMSGFNGLVETQTAQVITTINWSFLLGHAFLPILSVVIFLFIDVEKENRKLREG